VGAVLWALRGVTVGPDDLAVGDCLYVPAVADQTSDRPIGEPHDVAAALIVEGGERAACDASHGHEVSAIVAAPTFSGSPGASGDLPNHDQMEGLAAPLCEAAFGAYVGRPLEGSTYVTFPVVPDSEHAAAWVASGKPTVCLVARSDGQWMNHPARGSGE
jgi:Septum formation